MMMMMMMMREREVRDLVAGLLREAGVVDVETEPRLLPCGDEDLPGGPLLNRSTEARLDVRARGFWSWQQDAFLMCGLPIPQRPCCLDQKP